MKDPNDLLIYCWTNTVNGKQYYGSDTRGGEREKDHLRCIEQGCIECIGGVYFHKAVRKYGIENFEYQEIERGFGSVESLFAAEIAYIDANDSWLPNGYNADNSDIRDGGPNDRYEKLLDYLPPRRTSQYVEGSQIICTSRSERNIPSWALCDKETKKLLLSVFPRLEGNERQRVSAARWASIVYLYFRCGLSSWEVAEEMGISCGAAKQLVMSIKRVHSGRSANGSGLRGRKRGRPKKHACPRTPFRGAQNAHLGEPDPAAEVKGAGTSLEISK